MKAEEEPKKPPFYQCQSRLASGGSKIAPNDIPEGQEKKKKPILLSVKRLPRKKKGAKHMEEMGLADAEDSDVGVLKHHNVIGAATPGEMLVEQV